jgi:hypothetical protein
MTKTQLKKMKFDELLDLCQNSGIFVYNDSVKDDLIDFLLDSNTSKDQLP